MSNTNTNPLSSRLLRMSESATLKMAKLGRELKAQGHDIISLSLGEPDFDTPDHIKDAAIDALKAGYTKYTPVPGLPALREAIQAKFKGDNGLHYGMDEIVVSNGAKQSIANLSLALLNDGDEVIILAPYWVSYYEIVKLGGGVPVPLNAGIDQDFKVTAAQLEEAITDRTKLVLFSSPCNPTGSVYSKEELTALADVIKKRDNIYVISDEIYEYINFTDKHISIGSLPNMQDRTITVNGFSKGFAMTGWRLGYIGAPSFIAKACAKIQGQFTSGATAFGQMAAAHALTSDKSATFAMKKAFLNRKSLVVDLLNKIEGIESNNPQGAFYVFPDISSYFGKSYQEYTINNSEDFANYLLRKAHVAVVAGSAFGNDSCFRLSYAASEENLRKAIERMGNSLDLLS